MVNEKKTLINETMITYNNIVQSYKENFAKLSNAITTTTITTITATITTTITIATNSY